MDTFARLHWFTKVASLILLASFAVACGSSKKTPPNTKPSAFSFAVQSDVALSSVIESSAVTISGIEAATAVTITGGEYSINRGTYTSSAGTISNGQRIQVRVTSSDNFSEVTTARLTVGGVTASFTVSTIARDTTPDAFSFGDRTGVALSTLVEAEEPIVVGVINDDADISIVGGEYKIGSGDYTDADGTVTNGQEVLVRLTSSALFATETIATLTIGGVDGEFSVTTVAQDITPNNFSFSPESAVERNSVHTASDVITGITGDVAISITGGGEYSFDDATYTTDPGTIADGQTVYVRQTASSDFSTQADTILTIGTENATFSVTTEDEDTAPAAFSFSAVPAAEPNSENTSSEVVVTDINSPATISIDNGQYSINGGAATSADGTVDEGDRVQITLNAAPTPSTLVSATLNIGGVMGTYSVTTLTDTGNPTADIVFPPPVAFTEGSTVTIRGTAEDDYSDIANITVTVNGSDADAVTTIDTFATWNVVVDLVDGDNTVVVAVTDAAGNAEASAAQVVVRKGNIDDGSAGSAFPDNDNELSYPVSSTFDEKRNRILVSDRDTDSILSIDPATGVRTLFSTPTVPNANVPFASPVAMFIDPVSVNDRMWVGDISQDILYVVDLLTGERTIFSDDTTPNTDNIFNSPREMIINPRNSGELLVSDQSDGITAVDIATGTRTRFSSSKDDVPDSNVTVFLFAGIVYDEKHDRLLVADSSLDQLVSVSLDDGARTVFSTETSPSTNAPYHNPRSMIYDLSNNRVLVNNVGGSNGGVIDIPSLISTDIDTGEKQYFSNETIPDSNNALVEPRGIFWDGESGYALAVDRGLNALLAIDMVSGERVIYSKSVSCSAGGCP